MTFTKSQKFFYSCLAFLIGVASAEIFSFTKNFSLTSLVLLACPAVAVVSLVPLFKRYRFLFLLAIMLTLGNLWLGISAPRINEQHISFYNGQTKNFSAIVAEEPDVRLDRQKLTVSPTDYRGRVLFTVALYPEYEYGDLLKVDCELRSPKPVENFKYDKYLARYGVYSVCYEPRITLVQKGRGNVVLAGIFKFKNFFIRKINRTIGEPQAALLAGILIGSRQGLPERLLDKFNIAGVTHIIAISGFNITIIVSLLAGLAKNLYLSRKKSFWAILVGLIFFVILTGMSASVVRAAVMAAIVLLAKYLGRPSKVNNVLALSALIMVLFNPKILIWDAGFQLSFLSTIGLIYLSPKLMPRLSWLPEKLGLRENLASTLSAIIFTLPVILFSFQRLSVVAPFVNLLILPVIPFAMLVGFVQFLCAAVNLFLGQIIGWFSWLVLGYVVKVVEIFSSWRFAAVEIRIGWFTMLLIYSVLIVWLSGRGRLLIFGNNGKMK